MCGQDGIGIDWKNKVKILKKKIIVFANAPPQAFLFYQMPFSWKAKLKKKNDNAKVDIVGVRTGTEGHFSCEDFP